jgi:O-methyltransferase involved in polyketide biosynthesis
MTAGIERARAKARPASRKRGNREIARIPSGLEGISETMLWTLYDRACESSRADAILVDPDSVRICNAIDYDFAGHFGHPVGAFSARAAEIDRLLKDWLDRHPKGLVISLGEGLETQAHRVDNGHMTWLTVDLPPAIALRERFLPSSRRFRCIASSVFEPDWANGIKASADVFVVAQGLFMYLQPDAVRRLFIRIAERFPGAEIAFDAIPRWFSGLTQWGVMTTPRYRLPSMPWGINGDEIEAHLHGWSSDIAALRTFEYCAPRGWPKLAADLCRLHPLVKSHLPFLVHVKLQDRRLAGRAG